MTTVMGKFKVWDDLNGSERTAQEIEAFDAESAAIDYAENDVDGHADGLYTDEHGHPLDDVADDGLPIRVKDEDGKVLLFRVGVMELEPVYDAHLVEET